MCFFKQKNLFMDLFLTFCKIGLFTFGGGYAMIPMIEDACVEKKKWITHDDMINATVIAEATPGPIAINCATFVGFRQAGFAGACAATFGIILPSFCIIFLISLFFDQFLEMTVIAHAFKGIKIAVGFLIVDAALKMIARMKKKPFSIGILIVFGGILLLSDIFAWGFSSICLLAAAAVIGLIAFSVKGSA